jgi:hypothetical protein
MAALALVALLPFALSLLPLMSMTALSAANRRRPCDGWPIRAGWRPSTWRRR